MGNPSGIIMWESALPPVNPIAGTQELSIDTTTKALVKTDSAGNTYYLGSTATSNIVLIGKSLGAGTSVTASVAAGVATVTHNAHGYANGDVIVLAGGTSAGSIGDFNQLHVITGVATNTYTFSTTASAGAITGSPVEMFWFNGTRCINPTKIKNVTRSGTGVYVFTFLNTQTDIFYGIFPGLAYTSAGGGDAICAGSGTPTTTTFGINYSLPNVASHDADQYMAIGLAGIA
ncbi:MAG: hypothetical protein KGL39_38860 [Patescibacteria group bacterium]|nr:hypothetical protein [Patescibacteria group bacterium]